MQVDLCNSLCNIGAAHVCRYAVSGGQETLEEHRRLGGNLAKDVPYQWLRFFLDDDAELDRIGEEYSSGRMLTGEIKAILIKVLQDIVARHQKARALVSDDIVSAFMEQRDMTDLWD